MPIELLEPANFVGPESYVKERIAAFAESGVTSLHVTPVAATDTAGAGRAAQGVGELTRTAGQLAFATTPASLSAMSRHPPAGPPRAGPRRARRRPRRRRGRRSCCTPAARTSSGCARWPPGSATPAWWPPAGRASITYSRKVFIPLTRLCRDRCHYCTFVDDARAARARGPGAVPLPRRGARRSPARAPRWAARRRCSPSATGPRTAGREAREWLDEHGYDSHARLRAGDGDPGARGDRPAAAPQPRRHVLGGDRTGSSRSRRRWG